MRQKVKFLNISCMVCFCWSYIFLQILPCQHFPKLSHQFVNGLSVGPTACKFYQLPDILRTWPPTMYIQQHTAYSIQPFKSNISKLRRVHTKSQALCFKKATSYIYVLKGSWHLEKFSLRTKNLPQVCSVKSGISL